MMAILVIAVVLGNAPAAASPLAAWLAVQDPLEPCPVTAVLNGDEPARVDEAARLYHAGIGREVWLTSDPRSGNQEVTDAGTQSNLRRLIEAGGIPARAIHILPGPATGTHAELAILAAEVRRRDLPCVVIVTSPLHARRVKATWARIAGGAPRAVVRHARGAGYVGWWIELKELGGTLLARIGLPW
jgi:uncharacterized SAM-binding protein YcdF (DUF218 family)